MLGAARAGQFDEELKKASPCTLEESYRAVLQSAEEGDAFSAFQIAAAYEWEAIFDLLQPEEQKRENCYKWYEQAAKGGDRFRYGESWKMLLKRPVCTEK